MPDLGGMFPWRSKSEKQAVDVVITTNEINRRHGTGVLLERVLAGRSNIFSIRFRNDWGDPQFGDWNVRLPRAGANRAAYARRIERVLRGKSVRQVLCVPFLIEELLASIAIHDLHGARVCAWVMDDANLGAGGAEDTIPGAVMREFLEKCSLRLATHPELRAAYQDRYGLPFYLLPAVSPDHLIARSPSAAMLKDRAALLGSFWDQSWFDRLCEALAESGREIDWFGNHQSPWLKFPAEALRRARIEARGIVEEAALAAELPRYPFVLVPVSALDRVERNLGVASLSLPGRIICAAAAGAPLLVVGHEQTCAARFVRRFGIGEVAPYDRARLAPAMRAMCDPEFQKTTRANAARLAPGFSDRGIGEWLRQSIELGRPMDTRFEDIFAGY